MPQIGWLEILIIVVLAILIIGPKDFPLILKKIGTWIRTFKSYFSEVQKDLTDIENSVDVGIDLDPEINKVSENKNKDE